MRAVSLFSGCGGFCEGIELAGFEVAVAVEFDGPACQTYRANFPRTPLFEGDIHNFLLDGGSHIADYNLDEIDLVFGGPPCQGYSQIGPRNMLDERNDLYLQFARVVSKLKPKMFLIENVPNILLMNKGHFRDAIVRHMASIGYRNTSFVKLSAVDYGVPQTRERVFFYGTRDDISSCFDLTRHSNQTLDRVRADKKFTVSDAISDLPCEVVPSGETMIYPMLSAHVSDYARMMRLDTSANPYSKASKRHRAVSKRDQVVLYNHHTKEIQAKRANLIRFLEPGLKADSLPKELWNGARPEKWRRLHPDLPSYTILAQMQRDLSEWVHPSLHRWITVREAARLQSFHDGFVFKSSEWQQLKQVGNAVPPLLAYAVGQMAMAVLQEIAQVEDNGLATLPFPVLKTGIDTGRLPNRKKRIQRDSIVAAE